MDECPKQLIGETKIPIPGITGSVKKYDIEYTRNGTVDIFMFVAPHEGWRRVEVLERRTMIDWAAQIKHLVNIDFPEAEKIKLVCDNLNTHRPAVLYEAFPAEEARRILGKRKYITPRNTARGFLYDLTAETPKMSKYALEYQSIIR
jgi:hypothetical protein